MSRQMIAAIIAIAICVLAGFILINQRRLGEKIQLDMVLKIRTQSADMEYRASYHWGANEIETATSGSNIKWTDRIPNAQVQTSDSLSQAIDSVFHSITIQNDRFSIENDGKWSLTLQKELCDGVYINLDVDGDNSDVTAIIPSLSVSFLPSSLSGALSSLNIDKVNVVVTISVYIMGEIVKQYLQNCYDVIKSYTNLANDILDQFIGTLSVA